MPFLVAMASQKKIFYRTSRWGNNKSKRSPYGHHDVPCLWTVLNDFPFWPFRRPMKVPWWKTTWAVTLADTEPDSVQKSLLKGVDEHGVCPFCGSLLSSGVPEWKLSRWQRCGLFFSERFVSIPVREVTIHWWKKIR